MSTPPTRLPASKRSFILKPLLKAPINEFPEDVGWTRASRRPIDVHARKMGTEFTVVDSVGAEHPGQPGDYLIVFEDGTPTVVDADVFKTRYMEPSAAQTAPAEVQDITGVTIEQKNAIQDSVNELMAIITDGMRGYVPAIKAKADALQSAVTASPTRPPLYACPFCEMSDEVRDNIKQHVLTEHLMKALFGAK